MSDNYGTLAAFYDAIYVFWRSIEHFHLRYIFRYEMELLLRLAGFRLETVYGNFDRRSYDYHGGEMIFVARPL